MSTMNQSNHRQQTAVAAGFALVMLAVFVLMASQMYREVCEINDHLAALRHNQAAQRADEFNELEQEVEER